MPWTRKRAPIPSTALEERRLNEELSLISRRLKLCEDTLRADPDNTDALFTKGIFLAKIREFRRGLQFLDRVADLEPGYPGLWRAEAANLRELRRGDLPGAGPPPATSEGALAS